MAFTYASVGAGQTHTTIAAWEAATDINLATAGDIVVGCCIDQSFSENVVMSGASGISSTAYRILAGDDGTRGLAGSDQTFRQNTELRYNSSSGARMINSSASNPTLNITEDRFQVRMMQVAHDGNTPGTSYDGAIDGLNDNRVIASCIVYGQDPGSYALQPMVFGGDDNFSIVNSLLQIGDSGSGIGGTGTFEMIMTNYGVNRIINNTFVVCDSSNGGGNGIGNNNSGSYTQRAQNNIVMGDFGDGTSGQRAMDNSNSITYDWDGNISSDATADDAGGTGNQINIGHNETADSSNIGFTDDGLTTSLDARIKASSAGENGGQDVTGTTYLGDTDNRFVYDTVNDYDEDIFGNTRTTGSPDCGCYEITAAGGGGVTNLVGSAMRLAGRGGGLVG